MHPWNTHRSSLLAVPQRAGRSLKLAVLLGLVLTACGDGLTGGDAGLSSGDAGLPVQDAGVPSHDAGLPSRDAGLPQHDAGQPAPDAGQPDAGQLDAGGGTPTLPACFAAPLCDAGPPSPVAAAGFRNSISTLRSKTGSPNHRVHDLLLAPGDAQWVIGTVAYEGLGTAILEDEDVDVYLLRGCGAQWELLGTATTTKSGQHATVEGVEDTGGRVYFPVTAAQTLGLGRHRVRLVVKGDATGAEGFIEVQPRGSAIFVSDVDGTLTTSELAELGGIFTNTTPDANPNAAATYGQFVAAGYRPLYLTARTGTELARTRVFLDARGFPPGLVRTTSGNGLIGLTGSAAATYKAGEIQLFQAHGLEVVLGVGNTNTDAQAYQTQSLEKRFMFATDAGEPYGGLEFDAYADLAGLAALPTVCAGH